MFMPNGSGDMEHENCEESHAECSTTSYLGENRCHKLHQHLMVWLFFRGILDFRLELRDLLMKRVGSQPATTPN